MARIYYYIKDNKIYSIEVLDIYDFTYGIYPKDDYIFAKPSW